MEKRNYKVFNVDNEGVAQTMLKILDNNNITDFNGTETDLAKLVTKLLDKEHRAVIR